MSNPPLPAPAPRPVMVDACAALAGLGFGAVVAAVILGESRGSLAAPGGLLSAAGRLAGFAGTYFMLIMVVLIARLPWLESSVGQDRLVRWHRQLAPWAIGLITAHVVLITLGYAQASSTGALRELWVLVTSYRDMLAATVGFGLLIMAGISSYRHVRRRLRYETWWVIHLYLYLGLAMAFAHQIFTGVSFIGHPLVRALWIVVWAATAGLVLVYRVAQPAWRSLRHQLRVV
ncbi:MAG: ferric reductase-like transmembrane domain-containing protein, partial [Trebonia sp.]